MQVSERVLANTSPSSSTGFRNYLVVQGGPEYPKNGKADQAFFEKTIGGFEKMRPEQEESSGWITADDARDMARYYGAAWDVENYLPKAQMYKISEIAKAIIQRFDKNDDAEKVLGCNGKCDNPGQYLCEDGIISEQEAALASVKGATLFSKPKAPTPREKPESDVSGTIAPFKIRSDYFDHGGETNAPSVVFNTIKQEAASTVDTGGEGNQP